MWLKLHGVRYPTEAAQRKLSGRSRNLHSRVSGHTRVRGPLALEDCPDGLRMMSFLDGHLSTTRTGGKTYSVILNAFRLTLCTG